MFLFPNFPNFFFKIRISDYTLLTLQLYGAMWYSFAVERQLKCWIHACPNDKGCDLGPIYSWNCADDSRFRKPNMTVINLINKSCPIDLPNATIFDFGIYLYAIQYGMTRSENIVLKMLQGFWWGLRNLRFAHTRDI